MSDAVDAAIQWVGAVRYPRELTDDAAKGAAVAWCRKAEVVGPARDAVIGVFLRHARSARGAS